MPINMHLNFVSVCPSFPIPQLPSPKCRDLQNGATIGGVDIPFCHVGHIAEKGGRHMESRGLSYRFDHIRVRRERTAPN